SGVRTFGCCVFSDSCPLTPDSEGRRRVERAPQTTPADERAGGSGCATGRAGDQTTTAPAGQDAAASTGRPARGPDPVRAGAGLVPVGLVHRAGPPRGANGRRGPGGRRRHRGGPAGRALEAPFGGGLGTARPTPACPRLHSGIQRLLRARR